MIEENQFKLIEDLNTILKLWNNYRKHFNTMELTRNFVDGSKYTPNKSINWQMGLNQTIKLLDNNNKTSTNSEETGFLKGINSLNLLFDRDYYSGYIYSSKILPNFFKNMACCRTYKTSQLMSDLIFFPSLIMRGCCLTVTWYTMVFAIRGRPEPFWIEM